MQDYENAIKAFNEEPRSKLLGMFHQQISAS
jgi:hypothetical protein